MQQAVDMLEKKGIESRTLDLRCKCGGFFYGMLLGAKGDADFVESVFWVLHRGRGHGQADEIPRKQAEGEPCKTSSLSTAAKAL